MLILYEDTATMVQTQPPWFRHSHHGSDTATMVVGRDREQRSANDRADCWKAGSGTAAWSRCWSQRLVVSHDGADGCGSEEDGAGDLLHLHCDLLGFFSFVFGFGFGFVRRYPVKNSTRRITEKRLRFGNCCLRK
ncbi:hypothetical protein SDJN03_21584, partial [Cucurbita argyrosperma subsp. sororia]